MALVEGENLAIMKHEPMTRGHAERLAPMVAEVLNEAKLSASDLDGIAVTTGPGSFTGSRLGVSFARGLALATGVPAVGVSVFEAMAHVFGGEQVVVSLKGKNGTVLLQCFEANSPVTGPLELPSLTAWQALPKTGLYDGIGTEFDFVLSHAPDDVKERGSAKECQSVTSEIIARIGTERIVQNSPLPSPLYLRAPDAKPQMPVTLKG